MGLSAEYKKAVTPYLDGSKPTFATVLVSALVKVYGTELLNWDGITIQMEVKDSFGVDMPRKVYDQLMSLIAALNTTSVYSDVAEFDETINCFTGHGLGTYKGIPSVTDVAWTVFELTLNDPSPVGLDPKNRWSRAIRRYIRVVLDDEGMPMTPKILSMAADRAPSGDIGDPALYAAAWAGKQAMADEIDAWVDSTAKVLIDHLHSIGIRAQTSVPTDSEIKSKKKKDNILDTLFKKGEWTSEKNQVVHEEKHAPEFGGVEGYLAAEEEHSASPPEDQVMKDLRCKPQADGTLSCSAAYFSPSRGTLHVKRMSDGRTVTLYRVNKAKS